MGKSIGMIRVNSMKRVKMRYTYYFIRKTSILLAGTGIRLNSTVAFSPIKTHYFDYANVFSTAKMNLRFFNKILFNRYFIEKT